MNGRSKGVGKSEFLIAGFFFLLLTFLWCGPVLREPAHIAADVGDPLHMAWVMAWDAHQLLRDPRALFQSNNFYPYKNSLAFGDHLLPEAILGLPINLIGGNAVLALNLVTGFGLFSSAFAAWFLVSRLLGHSGAGLVAGAVLAFNSFTQDELLRVNVLQLQGWCLALFFLWRFVENPSWRNSTLFSLALAWQGLTGTYYAVYSAILTPGFLLAAGAARRRLPSRSEILRLALPGLLIGLSVLWFLDPYRRVAAQSLAQKPIPAGADLASFFLPARDLWLWDGALPSAPRGESNHFLGYLPLLLASLGIVALREDLGSANQPRRFLALAAAVLIATGGLIALGAYPRLMGTPLGEGPYLSLVRAFPILRGVGTVERASVLVSLGIALLAALGVPRLVRFRGGPLLALALASLTAAEQWRRPGPGFRVPAGSELPEVYRWLARDRGPVVELPLFPDRLLRFRALYPYFSTYHWREVPIGRASFYPPAHDYLATLLLGFPDPQSIEALRELRIHDVVVHPRMPGTDAEFSRALDGPDFELLRSFPGEVSASARDLDLGDERVYRLAPGRPRPSGCRPGGELERSAFTITSSAGEGMERIRDGDLATSWSTVNSQQEGDFLAFDLKDVRKLSAMALALGPRPSEFPTSLRVDIARAPDAWNEIAAIEPLESAIATLRQLVVSDPGASITIRIPPTEVRFVRLRLGRDERRPGWNAWSVAEIHFFSECPEPPKP